MNVIGAEGWNAFHFACYYGQLEVVENLLLRQVHINKETLEGWTPLQLTVLKGQNQIFQTLLKEKQLDVN